MSQSRFTVVLVLVVLLSFIAGCTGGGSSNPFAFAFPKSSSSTTIGSGPGKVSLTWTASATNTDGSPFTDLAGYKVYYGEASGSYTSSVDVHSGTMHSITGFAPGTYYFVVTAYNSTGTESDYSNEVSKTIQ